MKKLIGLLLALSVTACSLTVAEPAQVAQIGPGLLPTEQVIPAPAPSLPAITMTPSPESCKVISEGLHVRDSPGVQGVMIAWLIADEQVIILPDLPVDTWIRVRTPGGHTGWINSNYCESLQP